MKLNRYFIILQKQLTVFLIGLLFLIFNALNANAQSAPYIVNNMLFGSFINNVPLGSTAHLVLASDASGTVTADPGLIEITSVTQQAACIRIYFTANDSHHAVTITYGTSVYLKNGIYTILYTPPASLKYPDLIWDKRNSSSCDIYIGGTLTIGSPSVNPAGSYSGTLKVYYTYHNN
jgi:hypothetical protein